VSRRPGQRFSISSPSCAISAQRAVPGRRMSRFKRHHQLDQLSTRPLTSPCVAIHVDIGQLSIDRREIMLFLKLSQLHLHTVERVPARPLPHPDTIFNANSAGRAGLR